MARRILASLLLVTAVGLLAVPAQAETITFSGHAHGQVISNQIGGVTITAHNKSRKDAQGNYLTLAAIFDTTSNPTEDSDLEDPFSEAGNLAGNTFMGNALILAENNTGYSPPTDTILDKPDDEGSRRTDDGNWIKFAFDTELTELGWDVIDLEKVSAERSATIFTDGDGTTVRIEWYDEFGSGTDDDLESLALNTYGAGDFGFGDNSLNRFAPITVAYLRGINSDFGNIKSAQFIIGGSLGIDNLTYSAVPEPGSLALLATGLAVLVVVRRRRSI